MWYTQPPIEHCYGDDGDASSSHTPYQERASSTGRAHGVQGAVHSSSCDLNGPCEPSRQAGSRRYRRLGSVQQRMSYICYEWACVCGANQGGTAGAAPVLG